MPLTVKSVAKLIREETVGRYSDGLGLYLQIPEPEEAPRDACLMDIPV